ncbi:MAG: hypothetical protein EHM70_03625 [Chloroflexota bacterium]|nr:MAG: hypothetical protein EHM70_03625 [Chloroflexota bacterium]
MPVIKRYPNRKLYDTEAKQYITLDEIGELIRQGQEVHVVDHASGEDLTALTLTQIIMEQEKKQSGFLPRNILADLIRSGGGRITALQRTLASTLGMSRLADDEIERRIAALVTRGEMTAKDGLNLLEKLLSLSTPTHEETQVDNQEVIENVLKERGIPDRTEIQRLMDQVEALAAKLEDMSSNEEPSQHDDND